MERDMANTQTDSGVKELNKIFSKLSDEDIYIDVGGNTNVNVDISSFKNISWVDLIDDSEEKMDSRMSNTDSSRITSSSEFREFSSTQESLKQSQDSIKNVKMSVDVTHIEFDKIKEMDIKAAEDISILEAQVCVSNMLRKDFKLASDKIEYNDIVSKIDWLLDSSNVLAERVNLVLFKHPNGANEKKECCKMSIPRSSYKFCNYNYECEFNYNIKKHGGCYAQHYVHNMIWADLLALKEFIVRNKETSFTNEKNIIELKKSMNTISYVYNHMFDEINHVKCFNFFKNEKIHIERTPTVKKTKSKKDNVKSFTA